VKRLDLPAPVLSKLVEMGLGKGRKLTYVQRAPMGDPMVIELMGYRLALRNREACGIWVTLPSTSRSKQPGKKPTRKPSSPGKAA
jgi:Fe2+ transport system protein FeoA